MNEAIIIAKLQHYKGCAELDTCINTKLLNAAIELLEKSYAESSDLFYKLTGVMHFVDKWLDGKELEQDEVNRAATMRDKTLRLVEGLEREVNAAVEDLKNCMHFSNPKNNNVCNFCKKDMAEYPAKCKGWSEPHLCSPEWRGVQTGGESDV